MSVFMTKIKAAKPADEKPMITSKDILVLLKAIDSEADSIINMSQMIKFDGYDQFKVRQFVFSRVGNSMERLLMLLFCELYLGVFGTKDSTKGMTTEVVDLIKECKTGLDFSSIKKAGVDGKPSMVQMVMACPDLLLIMRKKIPEGSLVSKVPSSKLSMVYQFPGSIGIIPGEEVAIDDWAQWYVSHSMLINGAKLKAATSPNKVKVLMVEDAHRYAKLGLEGRKKLMTDKTLAVTPAPTEITLEALNKAFSRVKVPGVSIDLEDGNLTIKPKK